MSEGAEYCTCQSVCCSGFSAIQLFAVAVIGFRVHRLFSVATRCCTLYVGFVMGVTGTMIGIAHVQQLQVCGS